jgi:hypothetical protein
MQDTVNTYRHVGEEPWIGAPESSYKNSRDGSAFQGLEIFAMIPEGRGTYAECSHP